MKIFDLVTLGVLVVVALVAAVFGNFIASLTGGDVTAWKAVVTVLLSPVAIWIVGWNEARLTRNLVRRLVSGGKSPEVVLAERKLLAPVIGLPSVVASFVDVTLMLGSLLATSWNGYVACVVVGYLTVATGVAFGQKCLSARIFVLREKAEKGFNQTVLANRDSLAAIDELAAVERREAVYNGVVEIGNVLAYVGAAVMVCLLAKADTALLPLGLAAVGMVSRTTRVLLAVANAWPAFEQARKL